jgi:hypothetical protein
MSRDEPDESVRTAAFSWSNVELRATFGRAKAGGRTAENHPVGGERGKRGRGRPRRWLPESSSACRGARQRASGRCFTRVSPWSWSFGTETGARWAHTVSPETRPRKASQSATDATRGSYGPRPADELDQPGVPVLSRGRVRFSVTEMRATASQPHVEPIAGGSAHGRPTAWAWVRPDPERFRAGAPSTRELCWPDACD